MGTTNKQGQVIGRKGTESRRRLLDATRALIAVEPAHRISASGIARAAGLASQTFYLYFADIDEALLELSREASDDKRDVLDALDPADSSSSTPADRSSRFIEAFSAYWDRHRPILSVRNYLADNGHPAFLEVRHQASMPIIDAITDRIMAAQHGEFDRRSGFARAVVIYSAIERMAARPATMNHHPRLLSMSDLKKAEIEILTLLFTPLNDVHDRTPRTTANAGRRMLADN